MQQHDMHYKHSCSAGIVNLLNKCFTLSCTTTNFTNLVPHYLFPSKLSSGKEECK